MLAGNPRVFKILWEQLPVPNFVALALQLAPLLTANFPEPNLQLAPPLEPRVAAHHSIQLLRRGNLAECGVKVPALRAGGLLAGELRQEQLRSENILGPDVQLRPQRTSSIPELKEILTACLLQVIVPITVVWRHCLVAAELLQ